MAALSVAGRGRIFFFALTLLYLAFEFGFNARLLDVAGTLATESDVHALEFWGKSLSGFASALLLGKWLTRRFPLTDARALLLASPIIPLVFWALGAFIDRQVAQASNQERQMATYLALVPSAVLNRFADLQALDLEPQEFASPASKTFFALFPALAYTSPEVVKAIDRQLEDLLRRKVARELGTPEAFYNSVYRRIVNETKQVYNDKYLTASNSVAAGAANSASPGTYWDQYQQMLAKHHIDPYTANDDVRIHVVKQIQRKGIPVSNNFELADRDAFEQAVWRMGPTRTAASPLRKFADGASRALGFPTTMGPGMDWPAFAAHPDVQRKVAGELHKHMPGAALPKFIDLNWSPPEVEKRLYAPLVASVAANAARQFRADEKSFGPGGANALMAEKAVRRVLVPPIALSTSLFFSLLNLLGLVIDLCTPVLGLRRADGCERSAALWGLRVALVGAILVGPLQLTNPVAKSGAVRILEDKLTQHGARALRVYLMWVIKAEPAAYPFASAIREKVLFGFRFGAMVD